MSLSSDELWHRLLREGLASAEQCQQWARQLLPKLADSDANSGLKLLLLLIAAGHLSKYQAKIIAGQATGPLRFGPWVVEQPVKLPQWQGWYEVRRGEDEVRWARPVSAEQLKLLRPALPSLRRALKLSAIKQVGLVTTPLPELVDGTLLVFLASPTVSSSLTGPQSAAASPLAVLLPDRAQAIPQDGRLLCEIFSSQRCGPDEATRIARQLAEVLAELHRQQIVHGRVWPDRIYLQSERVVLAIDPLCAATGLPAPATAATRASGPSQTVVSHLSGVIGSALPSPQIPAFCAPELSLPEPTPSMASDVFSLGCVWWWLLTGQPPDIGHIHRITQPASSAGELRLPADGLLAEPVWRCLQACLARNPSSRFASAEALLPALLAAQRAKPISVEAVGSPPLNASATAQQPQAATTDRAATTTQPASTARPASTAQPARVSSPPGPRPSAGSSQPIASNNAATTAASAAAAGLSKKRQRAAVLSEAAGQRPVATGGASASASPPAISSARRRRRRQGIPWLWPILGGSGLLIGLLVILKITGALQPSTESRPDRAVRSTTGSQEGVDTLANTSPAVNKTDPRSEHFEIVAARADGKQQGLWAPPNAPDPLPLDMLPPGGQVFLSLRPNRWPALELPEGTTTGFSTEASGGWADAFDEQLPGLARKLYEMAGVPLADIAQVTLSFHAAELANQPPQVCGRFHLIHAKAMAELTTAWNNPTQLAASEEQLLLSNSQQAYYIPGQSQAGSEATQATGSAQVSHFSVGPAEMMREVFELQGARGPLLPHLEKLWNNTDQSADVSLLMSTPFLFTDGRALLNYFPSRLRPTLKQWLGGDIRGASMHLHWQPMWYLETRVVGTSDMDAGKILTSQQQQIQNLPATIEQWLVSHTAHPHWRALALRYPQMMRTFVDYTRFGVEQGTALMNSYLPSQGGSNLVLTSWIALQDYATSNGSASTDGSMASSPAQSSAATAFNDIEAYLSQPIELSFDQEPIEVALRLVADEANSVLPVGSKPLRFFLDGEAFGKAGITRNQQLSDFRIEQRPVREALTEIARRGNPVTTVTDLRQDDQRLLWLVAPDPDSASAAPMIWLTTRAAAKEQGFELPTEFAPAQ